MIRQLKTLGIILVILTGLMISPAVNAQVLEWNLNPEPDVLEYELWLDTDLAFSNATAPAATILHPITTYDITSLVSGFSAGVWYAKLAAIDTSGNPSAFSKVLDNVAPGVPTWKITINLLAPATVTITPAN